MITSGLAPLIRLITESKLTTSSGMNSWLSNVPPAFCRNTFTHSAEMWP